MDEERRLVVFIFLLTDDNISHFHRIDADSMVLSCW